MKRRATTGSSGLLNVPCARRPTKRADRDIIGAMHRYCLATSRHLGLRVNVSRSILIRRCRAVVLAFAAAVSIPAATADVVTGRASIISADTLGVEGQEIRLLGIDAPEIGQSCWDASSLPWPCGQRAALALTAKVGDAIVECKGIRRDRSARLIAVCRARETNLNSWLVAEGWALAYRSQSLAYVQAEEVAREQAKGLWVGAFEPPWVWRTKN